MRFLIITPPGSGQMTPHLNLSKKLEEHGHKVLWAMPKPVLSKIERAGFKYIEAGPENLNFEYRDLYCPGHSMTSGWDEFVLTANELIMHPTPRIVNDILGKLNKGDFDAVISEVGSPAGPILGEIWGIPWICISTESLAYHDEGIPPYAFEDEQEEGRPISDFYAGHRLICKRYNEIRKEFNLPPVESGWNDLFSKFLTICVTTPELEYSRKKFPEGLIFTGALTDPSPDPNLDIILREFINSHSCEKILYATLGTVFNKYPNLMEKVIRGVYLSKVTAVISTGPGYEVSDELLSQKPDNVIIVSWANHRALFPFVWAAVTHGGMSTTSDTISFGLPTLHIPVGCDLPSLSRKLVYHKSGLRISHKYATPEGIALKIKELMVSDEMKFNVAKLQKSFREAGGAPRAVQLIESALSKGEHNSKFISSHQTELVKKIAYILITAGETLAVAESSTGGLVSACILSVPGSSAFFIGGSVLYSYAIRDIIVNMGAEEHKKYGGSTPELISEIANRFQEKIGTTWVIGEGGAAGPSKSPYGHDAGYTALAIAGPIARTRIISTLKDNRAQNMSIFTESLLEFFLEVLEERHPNIVRL